MKLKPYHNLVSLLAGIAVFAAGTSALHSQTILYTNNFEGDAGSYTNNFVNNNPQAGGAVHAWSATAGVGTPATGGVGVTALSSQSTYKNGFLGFQGVNGVVFTGTFDFKAVAVGTDTNPNWRWGFCTGTNQPLGASGATVSTYVALGIGYSGPGAYKWFYRTKSGAPTQLDATGLATFNLTNGMWYRAEISFTYNGSAFTPSGKIYEIGTNGLATPVLTNTCDIATSLASAGLASAASVYAAVSANTLAMSSWDNFQVSTVSPFAVSTWASSTGGDWSVSGNWDLGGVPNGDTNIARFASSILAPSTVTNDAAHTVNRVVIENSAKSYTLGGSATLTLAGTSPGISVASGSHTVLTPLASSGAAVTLNSAGTLNLGSQSYTDGTIISGSGSVVVTNLGNGGVASGIGASSASEANLTLNACTLRYNGPGDTTDRGFGLGVGTSTIDASGAGALQWTDTTKTVGAIGAGASTLQLTGTNTGNNSLLLTVGNGSGTVSLTKAGTGKWIFGNSGNLFTGDTTVSAGTLALSDANALAGSANVIVAAGATLDVSGVSGYVMPAGKSLTGVGTVVGDYAAAVGNINPGANTGGGTIGTLTFANKLDLQGGTTNNLGLAALTNGASDKIVVNGDLALAGITTLNLNPIAGSLQAGTYTVMQYTGSLTGDASNFALINTTVYGITVSIDTTAKTVNLVVAAGTLPTYTWVGDGILNQWRLDASFNDWTTNGGVDIIPWLNAAHVVFDDTGSTFPVIQCFGTVAPASVTVNGTVNYDIGTITGPGSLTNNNTGVLTLSGTSSFKGGVMINAGTVKMNRDTALGTPASDNDVLATVASGATLDLNGKNLFDNSTLGKIVLSGTGVGGQGALIDSGATSVPYDTRIISLAADALIVPLNQQIGIRGKVPGVLDSRVFLNGHTLTKTGTFPLYFSTGYMTNGNLIIAQGAFLSTYGGAPAVFTADTTITISNGVNWQVGANSVANGFNCSGTVNLYGSVTNTQAGTVNFNGPFNLYSGYSIRPASGPIRFTGPVNGALPLNKDTAGTIILEGTNTYTGDTLITVGTLQIATNGSIATSPNISLVAGTILNVANVTGGFKVVSGQTLKGVGTLTGATTIQSGATLVPGGVSAIGTLTNSGGMTLAGNTIMDVNRAGLVSDKVLRTSGTIQFGGTLTIANQGATLVAGDAFTLFSTNCTGSFATFSPANPNSDSSLYWSLNPTTGVLTVLTVPTPEPLVFTNQNNTNLVFSWTQSSFKLQSQTNSLNVGLSTNWTDYPGGGTSPVNVPLSPTNPAAFFRLKDK